MISFLRRRANLRILHLTLFLFFIGLLSSTLSVSYAGGHESVKIGVLHSLSGTMAISETSLKDVVLMAVEEINEAGGVLGKKIEPVVVDPASDWPLFAEKAKQLLTLRYLLYFQNLYILQDAL